MGKVLGSTVVLFDPDTQMAVSLPKGSVLPSWAEEMVHESRLIDEHALSLFDRLLSVGASDNEITALRAAYDHLDDDDKDGADPDVSDDELREQLAELRSIAEAMTQAMAEDNAPPVEPVKPVDDMSKDELVAEVARLREQGVELVIAPPGNKPEIADALRAYREG